MEAWVKVAANKFIEKGCGLLKKSWDFAFELANKVAGLIMANRGLIAMGAVQMVPQEYRTVADLVYVGAERLQLLG